MTAKILAEALSEKALDCIQQAACWSGSVTEDKIELTCRLYKDGVEVIGSKGQRHGPMLSSKEVVTWFDLVHWSGNPLNMARDNVIQKIRACNLNRGDHERA